MKFLLILVATLFMATPAIAHPEFPAGTVRVYIYEDGDNLADSYGSGAIISPTLVLTNWHVVKDRRRTQAIQIRFANGSRSFAIVLQQNKKWDVALLKIHATAMKPFMIGTRPKSGKRATIHGFGRDYEYIAGTGKVSKSFFGPTNDSAGDFFQVMGVVARQGDSGGPITDSRGNLIGILFGSNKGKDGTYTMGVTIDRIKKVFGEKLKVGYTLK